jgi:hypothetical protein
MVPSKQEQIMTLKIMKKMKKQNWVYFVFGGGEA